MHKNKKPMICLVGNSGEIIGSNLGKKIDNCDEVIRFNDFVVEGYEDDCGSKTTIICLNFQEGARLYNIKDYPDFPSRKIAEYCEIWSARPRDINLDPHYLHRTQRCISWLGHANIIHPTKEQWERSLKNAYVGYWRQQPSTGLITIEMVLDRFKGYDIHLCGFDFNIIEKDHYFDDLRSPEFEEGVSLEYKMSVKDGHNWP